MFVCLFVIIIFRALLYRNRKTNEISKTKEIFHSKLLTKSELLWIYIWDKWKCSMYFFYSGNGGNFTFFRNWNENVQCILGYFWGKKYNNKVNGHISLEFFPHLFCNCWNLLTATKPHYLSLAPPNLGHFQCFLIITILTEKNVPLTFHILPYYKNEIIIYIHTMPRWWTVSYLLSAQKLSYKG